MDIKLKEYWRFPIWLILLLGINSIIPDVLILRIIIGLLFIIVIVMWVSSFFKKKDIQQ